MPKVWLYGCVRLAKSKVGTLTATQQVSCRLSSMRQVQSLGGSHVTMAEHLQALAGVKYSNLGGSGPPGSAIDNDGNTRKQ